jgi:hypothetical protein
MEQSSFLSRGKGKIKGDVKKLQMFNHYRKQSKKPVSFKVYNAFLKELLGSYSEAIVRENMSLRLVKIGNIRVATLEATIFNKDGSLKNNLRVDWVETWKYWHSKHPELTRIEIAKLSNKKVLYFATTTDSNEFYKFYWDKRTSYVKNAGLYSFTPARANARMIADEVSKIPRTTFYYSI